MSTTEQITLTAVGSDDDASAKKPINAALSFSQGGTYHISLKVPSAAELEDLHLTFLREGTSTRVIQALAQKTTEQLQCVALQDGVEARSQNSELRKDWERVRQLGGAGSMVIEGDRRLHAIPFEFVLPAPYGLLAEDISIVRKLTGYAPPEQRHATKQLQVLLVISRPWGANDVSHRHVADAVLRLPRNVNMTIDVLRGGGSLEQLTRRLGEQSYQVVHFDMHGELKNGRGCLRFESDAVDRADDYRLHDAETIAQLLTRFGVQLALFTACDSARAETSDRLIGRSLAHDMARYGIPATVGMNQPISKDGARDFASLFYKQLFAADPRQEVAEAFTSAKVEFRKELLRSGSVREDEWKIPTLYLRSNPDFTIEHAPEEQSGAPPEVNKTSGDTDLQRDFDHRLIDRALFSKGKPVLVRGLRGTGKTKLLEDLEMWWKAANYADTHLSVDCREGEKSVHKLLAEYGASESQTTSEDRPKQTVLYFKRADEVTSEDLQAQIRKLTKQAAEDSTLHVILSARSLPQWLVNAPLQTYDMLWLASWPSRALFRKLAGREDDILIAGCSDIPGVVEQIAGSEDVRNRQHKKPTTRYFDGLLPVDSLCKDLETHNIFPCDIHAFGGLKSFPLPLIERDLLVRYLMIFNVRTGRYWPDGRLASAPPEKLIESLEALGLLTVGPDIRRDRLSETADRFLRIHPYLPLLARYKLREQLQVSKMDELPAWKKTEMEPYRVAYAEMRAWRIRDFETLRSGRRVEVWSLDRRPQWMTKATRPEKEEKIPFLQRLRRRFSNAPTSEEDQATQQEQASVINTEVCEGDVAER